MPNPDPVGKTFLETSDLFTGDESPAGQDPVEGDLEPATEVRVEAGQVDQRYQSRH
jgi:hypothetical protein